MSDFTYFFSTCAILALIVIVIATIISHLKDIGKEAVAKAESQKVLDDLERDMKARRERQEKTLAEIALYPSQSEEESATWLFVDVTLSGNMLVEMAWMSTDAQGLLVDDWHGLPKGDDLEKLVEMSSAAKGVVMFRVVDVRPAIAAEMRRIGRDDLAATWLQATTIDIYREPNPLGSQLGMLYLDDEDAPVRGLDNVEARALIIYRCFFKMKEQGDTAITGMLLRF